MAGIGLDGLFLGWGLLDHWTVGVCLIILAEKLQGAWQEGFMGRGETNMKGEGIVLALFSECPYLLLPEKKHHNIIPLPASSQV